MDNKNALYLEQIENYKQTVLDAEKYFWQTPETGYKEWKTHTYLKERFEELGYNICEAGNIPGFYVDVDTGKPGPTIAVFGELDSLIVPEHPECDPETKAVHACGHCCQTAALLGVAIALKAPGALDEMCGKIRLIAVPAEELIELDYRSRLKEQGIIRYFSGKVEFLYRGYLDDVDISFMIHTSENPKHRRCLQIEKGNNGFLTKTFEFIGKSSHAGGTPQDGRNALYAATQAISATNSIRETFIDSDHIRFHPIITEGGVAVNAIPGRVTVESYVRGATNEAIKKADDRINLAFAGSAASLRCSLNITDFYGYMPLNNDKTLTKAFLTLGGELFGKEKVVDETDEWGTSSTDMGDISNVIPSIHPHIGGACGSGHGSDYYIDDPETAVVSSAWFQACFLHYLLKDNAEIANSVIAGKNLKFASKEEYFAYLESYNKQFSAVSYNEDGTVTIRYK